MSEDLELAELIAGLRAELEKARRGDTDRDIEFEVGPVEIEVTTSVTKKGAGKAGVRFWVVTAEASGELTTAATQRIKLTLDPRMTPQPSEAVSRNTGTSRFPLVVADEELENEL